MLLAKHRIGSQKKLTSRNERNRVWHNIYIQ